MCSKSVGELVLLQTQLYQGISFTRRKIRTYLIQLKITDVLRKFDCTLEQALKILFLERSVWKLCAMNHKRKGVFVPSCGILTMIYMRQHFSSVSQWTRLIQGKKIGYTPRIEGQILDFWESHFLTECGDVEWWHMGPLRRAIATEYIFVWAKEKRKRKQMHTCSKIFLHFCL